MGERRFKLSKPTTSDDAGTPSSSCFEDAKRVFRFIEDERHLIAQGLYHDVLRRLREWSLQASLPSRKSLLLRKSKKERTEQANDMRAAQDLIDNKQAVLDDLDVSVLIAVMLLPILRTLHLMVKQIFWCIRNVVVSLPKHDRICWTTIIGHSCRPCLESLRIIGTNKIEVLASRWKGCSRESHSLIRWPFCEK